MSEPADPETIRIFGVEDTDRTERALFRRSEEYKVGRGEIRVDEFRSRVAVFLAAMREVVEGLETAAGEYQLAEVQITAEVSAKGHLSLLGAGGELAGKGGMTFTFRKPV
jgi:hypothetical protein